MGKALAAEKETSLRSLGVFFSFLFFPDAISIYRDNSGLLAHIYASILIPVHRVCVRGQRCTRVDIHGGKKIMQRVLIDVLRSVFKMSEVFFFYS